MTPRIPRGASRVHVPRLGTERREQEAVKPLELFFDLVFVLGFTQCTALMAAQSSWEGIVRGMLVLAMLWWATYDEGRYRLRHGLESGPVSR